MQTDMRTKKQIFMLLLALLVGIPTLSAQQRMSGRVRECISPELRSGLYGTLGSQG